MAEILLLGSDKSLTSGIVSLLRLDRHIVYILKEVEHWRDAEAARAIDLILAAIRPSEWMFTAGSRKARGFPTPILFVQQGHSLPPGIRREERLIDRMSIPFEEESLLARIDALVRVGRVVRRMWVESGLDRDASALRVKSEGVLWRLAVQVSSFMGSRIPRYARPHAPYVDVAARVAAWGDRRDAFEPGHAERVATFCALIAGGIGLRDDETAATVRAAMLHDIGKVTLPSDLLRQGGPLAVDQKRLIQTHPNRGVTILEALDTDPSIIDAIRRHHERVDGRGSLNSSGRDLSLPARILAVADVYDAMTSTRVNPPLDQVSALRRICGLRGGQLDPDCVDALVDALKPRPGGIPATGLVPESGRIRAGIGENHRPKG